MKSIINETTLIQNNTEGNSSVRKAKNSPQNKNIPNPSLKEKSLSSCWLSGELLFARNCPFRNHICNTCGRKGHKETKCRSGAKVPSLNRTTAKKEARPSKSISVISSTYKTDGINQRQYVTLKINDQGVRLQLATASEITLISREIWKKFGSPAVRPSNHVTGNASGNILKLEGEVSAKYALVLVKFERNDL